MNTAKNNQAVNKSSQQKGFFALDAFALQIGQNLGCKQLPLGCARSRLALLQIFAMPCLCAHGPPSFCSISPEAVLLTFGNYP
jgi:hypothetical protein